MRTPTLSIIIPTLNAESTLEKTLDNILSQTFQDLEIWLIDARSSDFTLNIIYSYAFNDPRIKWISESDKGILDAWNKGARISTGHYLFFMKSNSLFTDKRLLKEIFDLYPPKKADVIYGNGTYRTQTTFPGPQLDLKHLVKHRTEILQLSAFYSRRVFETVGEFDNRYRYFATFDFLYRCFDKQQLIKRYFDSDILELKHEKAEQYQEDFPKELVKRYVYSYENPIELFLKNEKLQNELDHIYHSEEFQVTTWAMNPFRRIKSFLLQFLETRKRNSFILYLINKARS